MWIRGADYILTGREPSLVTDSLPASLVAVPQHLRFSIALCSGFTTDQS